MTRLPPGLDTPLSAAEVQHDPIAFLTGLVDRFGDICTYEVDGRLVVFVNRPDYVKHVLQERHRGYAKVDTPDMMMLRPMLGDGLLTTDGDIWMRQRRLAQPAFHRERIEAFSEVIVEETDAMIDRLSPRAVSGEAFEIGDELTQLTTRVVARALFSMDVGHLVTSFGAAVQAMNEFMGHYDPNDRGRLERFVAARTMIDKVVREVIESRRNSDDEDRGDFLSILLAARTERGEPLSEGEVRDQVMTLLMAGHETTAKVLTWSLFLLDRHPDTRKRLVAEVDRVLGDRVPELTDLPQLPYAWMVLQEAMRIYPPVWIISRTAMEDDVIEGWAVPKGALVLVCPFTLHRHAAHWPDPESFDPNRFLPELDDARAPFAFMPFSGGPRQCIGKSFARLESHLALVRMTQRWKVAVAADPPVEPEALVTLRPRFGLTVCLAMR